jgi:ankyrin repeat protein
MHLVSEGNSENAVEVANILMTHDIRKEFIKVLNNSELNPLHVAIEKKADNMVNFLLKPENKCDLSGKNAMGRTVLHYACHASGIDIFTCFIF